MLLHLRGCRVENMLLIAKVSLRKFTQSTRVKELRYGVKWAGYVGTA